MPRSFLGWNTSKTIIKKLGIRFWPWEAKQVFSLTEDLLGSVTERPRMGSDTNRLMRECGTCFTWNYIIWNSTTIAKRFPLPCNSLINTFRTIIITLFSAHWHRNLTSWGITVQPTKNSGSIFRWWESVAAEWEFTMKLASKWQEKLMSSMTVLTMRPGTMGTKQGWFW